MFTIEMDWDETAITVLDSTGKFEDLQVIIYEDIAYIRQWDEDIGRHHLIAISPEQLLELSKSFKLPVGTYMMSDKET